MVYGPDGRPLVVALDATGEDLRLASVGPGMYRLDAVDNDRKPLGVTAYTEIIASDDDESPLASMAPTSPNEAALLTMSRQMELMLRQAMQAQRDLSESLRLAQRESSENLRHVLTKLTDLTATRVGGASWKDFDDYEKRKEKVVATEIARRNGAVDEQELEMGEEGEDALWWSPLVKAGAPIAAEFLDLGLKRLAVAWGMKPGNAPEKLVTEAAGVAPTLESELPRRNAASGARRGRLVRECANVCSCAMACRSRQDVFDAGDAHGGEPMGRRDSNDESHAAALGDTTAAAGDLVASEAETPASAPDAEGTVEETGDLTSMLEALGVPPGLAERYGRMFDAVFDELAAEERQLLMDSIPVLPNELRIELAQPMLTMSTRKAAQYVRDQVLPKVRKVVAESNAKDGES
jgi:hypothetical protein